MPKFVEYTFIEILTTLYDRHVPPVMTKRYNVGVHRLEVFDYLSLEQERYWRLHFHWAIRDIWIVIQYHTADLTVHVL